MAKILRLTREQEEAIPEYIERYVSLSGQDESDDDIVAAVSRMWENLQHPNPHILIAQSPWQSAAMGLLGSQLDSQLGSQLGSQLRSQLGSQLGSRLSSQLRSQLDSQLDSQLGSRHRGQLGSQLISQLGSRLRSQLRSQLGSRLRGQLDSQLVSQLGSQLGSQLRSQLISQLGSQLDSQPIHICCWWSVNAALYRYAKMLGVDNLSTIEPYAVFAEKVNSITAYHGLAIPSRKPKIYWLNKQLHREGGMAVQYQDGYGLWCLHGVSVPSWLAETKSDEIDVSEFAKIENAEVRREFILKVGIERIVTKLNVRRLDQRGDYELLSVPLGGRTGNWPYLKMLNPSLGVWHLEAVDKSCYTVEQALNWRNQTDAIPAQLT